MLLTLLAKDLARARRNPLPWLVFLLVPLCTVALVGLAVGGLGKEPQQFGRIRFALVDEDNSPITRMLRGGLNQGEAAQRLEPVFLDRPAALAQLNANKLSAVVIIPENFTADFLHSRPIKLELIKNPAESIKPTVLEEGLGVVTSGLNGIARNFAPDLVAWREVIEGEGDYRRAADLFAKTGDRVKALGAYLNPPLIGYTKPAPAAPENGASKASPGFNLFGYLLLGMAAMFLLFLGGVGMSDLHREIELRTLARYRTLHDSLVPFVGAKVVFTAVMLLLCSTILFGGGALVFGVTWSHPLPLLGLVLAYTVFVTGLMAVLVAWMPNQGAADAVRSMVSMLLGLAGGCAFPPDNLPAFFREQLMPLLPTHWFVSAARALEFGGTAPLLPAALKLILTGATLLAVAAWLLRQRFSQGARS